MVKLLGDVLAEAVASTSWRDAPAASVVGVGPQKVADGTFVRGLLDAVQLADLVEGVDAGREATMQAEDLVLNDSSEGQVVEQLSELLPHVRIAVLSQALIVEAVPNKVKHFRSKSDFILSACEIDLAVHVALVTLLGRRL